MGEMHIRSVASVALAQLGLGDAEIGARIRVKARSTITHYRRGTRVPALDVQERIEKVWPHITPELWRKPWTGAESVPPAPSSDPASIPPPLPSPPRAPDGVTPSDLVTILEEMLRTQSKIERDETSSPEARAKAGRNVINTANTIAKLRGDMMTLDEAKIVRSAPFRRVVALILDILRPWPEALLAIGTKLRDLEST